MRNGRIVLVCVVGLAAMTGAAYAAVPLYRAFCQATGFAGTVSRRAVRAGDGAGPAAWPCGSTPECARPALELRAANSAGNPLRDRPERPGVLHRHQQLALAKPLTGRAAYNVSPDLAGAYFHKIKCFCFDDQTIAAHTTMRFPVVYFVDPKFASDPDTKDFQDVTLSYTFYPVANPKPKPIPAPKVAGGLGGTAGGRL